MSTQIPAPGGAPNEPPRARVAMRGISKHFGTAAALDRVSLDGHAGSIHAITGENGAGKSTLMKVLAGVHRPDEGEIALDGRPVTIDGPDAARRAGISTVFQELSVLPNLSVAENLVLGREPTRHGWLSRSRMLHHAHDALERFGIGLDPGRLCGGLTLGERQLVEIAKGLAAQAGVFILDEPTAAIERADADRLAMLLGELRTQGKLVFYISHRLEEIFRLCDTVTILKDGRLVTTEPLAAMTRDRMVSLMVGRPLRTLYPPRERAAAEPLAGDTLALDVRSLRPRANGPTSTFQLRRGEIVGLGGLVGQGQREIVRALAGAAPPFESDIWRSPAPGSAPQRLDPEAGVEGMVRHGIGLVPEDRRGDGIFPDLSTCENLQLGRLRGLTLMRGSPADDEALARIALRAGLDPRQRAQAAGALSGGQQQKVMIGRWLAAGVDTLLIEQPTRGVDVGVKADIYRLLRDFAAQGGAVLAVSSDLLELIGLCDRILMVRGGKILRNVASASATEESLMTLALVGEQQEVAA